MIQHLKTVKMSLIIGILLLSVITLIPHHETTVKAQKAISFHSYLEITYDISPLNQPLQIDVAISIPVTVKFWTDIPSVFALKSIRFPFSNLFLFGAPIGPEQQIHLEINNQPTWANVYFSSPDILADIPFEGETPVNKTVNLIISPKVEAPAEPQSLDITASSQTLKRLNGFSQSINIPFTPSFIPTIAITMDEPIRTVGPHQSVNFNIQITNSGNKITRVTPVIIGADSAWTPTINPPQFEIQPNQANTFTFSIITPFDFGWHNQYGRFEINFDAQVYPFVSGSPTSNQSVYVVVNNHGFSTPGFEAVIFIIAIFAVALILQKRHARK